MISSHLLDFQNPTPEQLAEAIAIVRDDHNGKDRRFLSGYEMTTAAAFSFVLCAADDRLAQIHRGGPPSFCFWLGRDGDA